MLFTGKFGSGTSGWRNKQVVFQRKGRLWFITTRKSSHLSSCLFHSSSTCPVYPSCSSPAAAPPKHLSPILWHEVKRKEQNFINWRQMPPVPYDLNFFFTPLGLAPHWCLCLSFILSPLVKFRVFYVSNEAQGGRSRILNNNSNCTLLIQTPPMVSIIPDSRLKPGLSCLHLRGSEWSVQALMLSRASLYLHKLLCLEENTGWENSCRPLSTCQFIKCIIRDEKCKADVLIVSMQLTFSPVTLHLLPRMF